MREPSRLSIVKCGCRGEIYFCIRLNECKRDESDVMSSPRTRAFVNIRVRSGLPEREHLQFTTPLIEAEMMLPYLSEMASISSTKSRNISVRK